MPSIVRTILSALAALAAVAQLAGCATNPATGERFFSLYSWDQEVALGLEATPQFTEQFGGEVPHEGVRGYVAEVGSAMVPHVEEGVPEDLPWSFHILNSDVLNAFALPGGQVFITRGLASKLDSEAELAGVLGHEIGHVTARHGNQRLSNATLLQGAVAGAALAVGMADEDSALRTYGQLGVPAMQVGGQLVLLKYGRDDELEADGLGMRYMSKAGYKPSGQREVMRVLADMSEGAQRPPEFLSTHPFPEDRIAAIDRLLAGEFRAAQASADTVLDADEYRRRMLEPLASLPPAPPPPPSGGEGGSGSALLPASASWCLVCRADSGEANPGESKARDPQAAEPDTRGMPLAARWAGRLAAH